MPIPLRRHLHATLLRSVMLIWVVLPLMPGLAALLTWALGV